MIYFQETVMENKKEYMKEYRIKNKEKIKKQVKQYKNKYYSENKEKVLEKLKENYNKNKGEKRNRDLKYKYNITLEDYNLMLYKQNYKCLICKEDSKELNKPLVVDHNHSNGKVRGLLCNKCNPMIGFAKDDIKILKEAIEYLTLFENE